MERLAARVRENRNLAVLAVLVLIAAAALIAAVVWPVTDLIAAHDVGRVAGPLRAVRLEAARDAARGQLLQVSAGLLTAAALIYTARNFTISRHNVWLIEQGQLTDRYTRAIEQLGSGKLAVRIGGIYALERIARDSARDHPAVMEVLATFIREQKHLSTSNKPRAKGRKVLWASPDVQAAATVIGRRNTAHDGGRINLSCAILAAVDLQGADLAGVDLSFADLRSAELTQAKLSGADLWGADLDGARLLEADLTCAELVGAKLNTADLAGSDLTGADLTGARLDGSWLSEAKLNEARLNATDLTNADLRGANLTDALFLAHPEVAGPIFTASELIPSCL